MAAVNVVLRLKELIIKIKLKSGIPNFDVVFCKILVWMWVLEEDLMDLDNCN